MHLKNNQTLANGATVTIYPTTTESTNYVVYLHGGGMIYGTKSDLPEELKELFTSNGYTVLALDYLLAPNTKIDHIL
ncbi:alpha/beta hydrolase, partial [Enterococcus faecalis]